MELLKLVGILVVVIGFVLKFDTMATVFNNMGGGRLWGTIFFLFMVFAAMSTVLAVCENILAMVRELTGWSRPKGCIICGIGLFITSTTTAKPTAYTLSRHATPSSGSWEVKRCSSSQSSRR